VAFDVGEGQVAAVMLVGKVGMILSHLIQYRRLEVVKVASRSNRPWRDVRGLFRRAANPQACARSRTSRRPEPFKHAPPFHIMNETGDGLVHILKL